MLVTIAAKRVKQLSLQQAKKIWPLLDSQIKRVFHMR